MNFKKIMIVMFMCFGITIYAQDNLSFGVKGGVNLAGFRSGQSTFTSRVAPSFGGMVEWKFSKILTIQGELLYNSRGGNYEVEVFDSFYLGTLITKLGYLDIPIQGKLYFLKKMSFDFGPQIGFLLSKKGEIDTGAGNEQDRQGVDLDDVNTMDFSLAAGFSYKFKSNILIQTRYNFGLSKVFDDKKYKTSLISLSLGYYFQ